MNERAFDLPATIETVRKWAKGACVTRVWLFGSRAQGTHRPDSDLDIALAIPDLVDGETAATVFHFEGPRWSAELSSLTGCDVHLQHLTEDADAGPWVAEARACIMVYKKV